MRSIFLSILLSLTSLAHAGDEIIWNKIADDLELARVAVDTGPLFSGEMVLLRTSLKRFEFSVLNAKNYDKETANARFFAEKSKAAVVLNANFFDEDDKPLGLVIHHGKKLNDMHRGGRTLTGVFYVTRSGMGIVHRDSFSVRSVIEAVQAGPRLIVDGEPVGKLKKSSNRRSGLCIDREQRLVLFSLASGLVGLTPGKLQDYLLSPEINCWDALNLDGGGSAQLYVSSDLPGAANSLKTISIQGADPVPVAIALLARGNGIEKSSGSS